METRNLHSLRNMCPGLADVFNPRRKPWVDLSQAETQQIIEQVKKCPGGALSIEYGKTTE